MITAAPPTPPTTAPIMVDVEVPWCVEPDASPLRVGDGDVVCELVGVMYVVEVVGVDELDTDVPNCLGYSRVGPVGLGEGAITDSKPR